MADLIERPDWKDNDAYRCAARCAEVLKEYGCPEIDLGAEGLRLIANFAYALNVDVEFRLTPKARSTKEPG